MQPIIKLYNTDRNGTDRYWYIHRDKDTLFIEYGQVGTEKACTTSWLGVAKNVGRSNEISAEQDAQNELERLVLSKEREGYTSSLLKSEDNVMDCPEQLRFYKPLAEITEEAINLIVTGNPIITRKYDGEMMVIKVNNGWTDTGKTVWASDVQIFSRTMLSTHHVDKRSWNERFPNIVEAFSSIEGQHIFTGEMVKDIQGPDDRKHVASVLKSKTEKAIEVQTKDGWLQYVIWDWPVMYGQKNVNTYGTRLQYVIDLVEQLPANKSVGSPTIVYDANSPARTADAKSFIESLKEEAEYAGWEGFILADGDDSYADKIYNFRGKTDRPKTFCKIKPVYEDDFVAMWAPEDGYGTYGKGRHEGKIGAVALFQYNSNGDLIYICDCGSGIDDDARTDGRSEDFPMVWQVKYESRTYQSNGADTNALQFPRLMLIRTDKQIEECINEQL